MSAALITGCSSGIGLETARILLRAGARVAICGRDASRLDAALSALAAEASADRLLAARCDVLDAGEVERFAGIVAKRFGGADILINNAGQGRVSTFADTTDEAWREELELKFFSVIRPTRAFLPQLERSDAAAIVCVNSLLARQPEPRMVATSAARATRPGTSGTTSSATDGRSSTARRRPSPDGRRASPRVRPPPRCAG